MTAEWIVNTVLIYAAVGFAFAVAFARRGAGRLDPLAGRGSLGFRVVIIPASAALWPLLAWRWARAKPSTRTSPGQEGHA